MSDKKIKKLSKALNKSREMFAAREVRLNLPSVLCALFIASTASADIVLDSVGIIAADSVKKFDGMRQQGLKLDFLVGSESSRFWIPRSLNLSSGWLERGDDTAGYVSFGPSYRMHLSKSDAGRWYADLGIQPTYIDQSRYGGKDIGGRFFFTSYLGVGAYLDRKRRASFLIRYQHTSNASLDDPNPGVDMLALTLSYRIGSNRRAVPTADASGETRQMSALGPKF